MAPETHKTYCRFCHNYCAFEVDVEWESGRLKSAALRSDHGGSCVLQYGSRSQSIDTKAGETVRLDGALARR